MEGSRHRVRAVIRGDTPDRPPLYDMVRNDAVLSHFAGEKLTLGNAERVVPAAMRAIVDATRPQVRKPQSEQTTRLADGRRVVQRRWTTWREKVRYASTEVYAQRHGRLADSSWEWSDHDSTALESYLRGQRAIQHELEDVFLFWSSGVGPSLMGLHGEVGLEFFSYLLADCPEVISLRLEYNTVKSEQRLEHWPVDCEAEAVFLGDDIAYKSGPMISPAWMRREYFPRLRRVISAFHARGIRVLFHSDGNLMPILDDLVEAGVDGLNPIEVAAGMDIAEIHRRHPHLFLCGGIDVSQLLPYGAPQQIRDAVVRAVDDAGGRLMVGSTTEVHDDVPLANFLAMWETVVDWQ